MQSISVLIFYPATFAKFIDEVFFFLVVCLGFSRYSIMSSGKNESFTSAFLIWIIFIYFYSFISMARASKTILNSSDETILIPNLSRNSFSFSPCLVPDLSGNSFTIENVISSGVVIYGLYYVAKFSLYAHFLEVFIINWCWILSNAISASNRRIVLFLFFSLKMWCITLMDL